MRGICGYPSHGSSINSKICSKTSELGFKIHNKLLKIDIILFIAIKTSHLIEIQQVK